MIALRLSHSPMQRCLIIGVLLFGVVGASEGWAQGFEQRVSPFSVRDTAGVAYERPFLGGFNAPRPKLVDIDRDGDLDLFVQERAGRLIFFEREGGGASDLTWRTDHYKDLDVGAWARFADLDDDGDPDLLAEDPISGVRYYRNGGTNDGPDFTLAAAPLTQANGERLFAERQNVPALASLDCQGPPDLLLGGLDGRLQFYRYSGTDSDEIPLFTFVSDAYQGVCVGPASVCGMSSSSSVLQGGTRARHGANALAAGDLGGDGDPDILWGDFFSQSLYLLENTGTCDAPDLERVSDVFPTDDPIRTSGYNAPALGDLDGDDDLDLLVGVLGGSGGGASAVENFLYLENTGSSADASYALRTRRFLSSIDLGAESVPALVDLDDDGLRDLIVGNSAEPGASSARLHRFHNVGTDADPAFVKQSGRLVPDAEDGFNFAPAFADVDANGTKDLFLGTFSGTVRFYRNVGTAADPEFQRDEAHDVALPRGNFATPALVDIDADGDQDLFVGSASAEGTVAFFRNEGTAADPSFVLAETSYQGIETGVSRTHPSFADVDGDGDPDLLLGMRDGISLFRNAGTAAAPDFRSRSDSLAIPLRSLAAPALADLDADQRLDLVAGGQSGGVKYFAGTGTPIGPSVSPGGGVLVAPNPFATSTRLVFSLTDAARVHLSVYDVMGRRVAVLVDRRLGAGPHYVPFDGRGKASAMYLYVLRVDNRVRDRGRLIHVR